MNVLFRFNIESSQIDRFENEDGSEPGIPTYLFNGRILTLKNIVTDESTTTFIEAVNVEKNEWEKVPVFILIIKTGLYILFTVL